MNKCFCKCSSLEELDITNFEISNNTDKEYIFDECSDDFINKMKSKYKFDWLTIIRKINYFDINLNNLKI